MTDTTLYAAVVETKGYVVGAENAPSGLHRHEKGTKWTHFGWKNVRNFGVAADPSHPDTLYLAAGNGVFRSKDGGRSWRITTDWRVTEVLAVAVDPQAPANIYAATAYGVWHSPDGGETWEERNRGIPAPQATFTPTIEVDHEQEGHLIVGSEKGLFRSTDGGAHWRAVGPRDVAIRAVKQSRAAPRRWLAGTDGRGVLLSRDGGRTWQFVGDDVEGTMYAVAFDPSNPGHMAAAGYDTGVYLSPDGGESWRHAAAPDSQNVHALVFDITAPGRLWAGTTGGGVFYTDDLGARWTRSGLDGAVIWDLDFLGTHP